MAPIDLSRPGQDQARPTLGSRLRGWRMRHGLTLKEMSERTGIPFSTLSKVEHDRLTLTYEKLHTVSERMGTPLSALLSEPEGAGQTSANSRRSIATRASAMQVMTPIYDYFYMAPELRRKAMIPILSNVKARSIEEFGDLVRHRGEEYFYVLSGRVEVHTEFYDPVTIGPGESVYIDSTMGHAYVLAAGCAEATALCVCSSSQEELVRGAEALAARAQDAAGAGVAPKGRGRRRAKDAA